ncbi:hypothetical protein B0W47_06020 [Komagataeibacter nataicola]|uniref:Conjugal transfer protein TraW n=1 Tax=Komagataeibacter nataicola TaxID=265960 RepID=A0A9N7H1N7_9PROT|nr:hypothetical protein [Komagataeibacter nataicola]AQU87105.1 hypothetical protein B0W47_06020 [Komagataeibacter nataicola]PYD65633.1 hypothetical protein CDI09_12525 [Komagataeibacter nataicola]GBR25116.1 hypothetical protein AA0616_2900 [Komagataeibacter nataicola NRIC 0616]
MRRLQMVIIGVASCVCVLAVTPRPAYALFSDAAVVAAIKLLQAFTGNALNTMTKNLTDSIDSNLSSLTNPNSVASLLTKGFTQVANYAKAQVGAQSQLMDAQDAAMAGFLRRQQETGIRDEHMMNPEFCAGLDAQQSTVAASKAARSAVYAIATVSDPRGEAGQGTPSYYGKSQGTDANMSLHLKRYCSSDDVAQGLCSSVSRLPNADQRAASLFGADTLSADGAVDAANDYATTLIQPVAPAALRGEQLSSLRGREAATRRRSYNSRMSLARWVTGYVTSLGVPSVTLTRDQKAEMTAEGLTPLDKASWLQAMALEVNRRVSSVSWNASLQAMPPASVMREVATEMAQSNYLALQNYRLGLYLATMGAARVAQGEEVAFKDGLTPMPSPTINP